ncbi:MAG: hypothetical protein LC648_04220 [Novosphingobium sp.]|nr:hypothetical protein [Novosphingobium sp.]
MMRISDGLVAIVMAASLTACSQPAPEQQAGADQATSAAPRAALVQDQPLTLTDGDGNELDPEIADAVQESVERQEMERQEAGEAEGGDWGSSDGG